MDSLQITLKALTVADGSECYVEVFFAGQSQRSETAKVDMVNQARVAKWSNEKLTFQHARGLLDPSSHVKLLAYSHTHTGTRACGVVTLRPSDIPRNEPVAKMLTLTSTAEIGSSVTGRISVVIEYSTLAEHTFNVSEANSSPVAARSFRRASQERPSVRIPSIRSKFSEKSLGNLSTTKQDSAGTASPNGTAFVFSDRAMEVERVAEFCPLIEAITSHGDGVLDVRVASFSSKQSDSNGMKVFVEVVIADQRSITKKHKIRRGKAEFGETLQLEGVNEDDTVTVFVKEHLSSGDHTEIASTNKPVRTLRDTLPKLGEESKLSMMDGDGRRVGSLKIGMAFSKMTAQTSETLIKDMVGTLVVVVESARGLKAFDMNGKSDPYCVLELDGKTQQTSVQRKTLEPQYSERFEFDVGPNSSRSLRLDVWDWDRFKANERMAGATVDLAQHLRTAPAFGVVDVWLPLNGNAHEHGEVRLFLSLKSPKKEGEKEEEDPNYRQVMFQQKTASEKALTDYLNKKDKGADGTVRSLRASDSSDNHKHRLVVTVHAGRDLVKKDLIGSSDPYCVVKIGPAKRQTRTIKRNLNPDWNEKFTFNYTGDALWDAVIELRVHDWDRIKSHAFMGDVLLNISEMFCGEGSSTSKTVDHWFPLQNTERGMIHVRLEYSRSDPVPAQETRPRTASILTAQPLLMEDTVWGTVHLSLVQAFELVPEDKARLCHAYVKMSASRSDGRVMRHHDSHEQRSSTKRSRSSPYWDETFAFTQLPPDSAITLVVYSWSLSKGDKLLGTAKLDTRAIAGGPGVPADQSQDIWLPLRTPLGRTSGADGRGLSQALSIRARFVTQSINGQGVDLVREASALPAPRSSVRHDQAPEFLDLCLIEGADVPRASGKGYPNPFVLFRLGEEEWESSTEKNTACPRWNAPFRLNVPEGCVHDLQIEVFDWSKNSLEPALAKVGDATLPISAFEANKQMEQWVALQGERRGAKIRIRGIRRSAHAPEGVIADTSISSVHPYGAAHGRLSVQVARVQVDTPAEDDPSVYVVLSVGSDTQETAIHQRSTEAWDTAVLEFDHVHPSNEVEVSLYRWVRDAEDDLLGVARLPMQSIPAVATSLWVTLSPALSGSRQPMYEVLLHASFLPDRQKKASLTGGRQKNYVTMLSVFVLSGHNLSTVDGEPNAFIELSWDGKLTDTSAVRDHSASPVWNEAFDVRVTTLDKPLELRVLSWSRFGKTTVLGTATVPLSGLEPDVRASRMVLLGVEDGREGGHVRLELTLSAHLSADARERPRAIHCTLLGASMDLPHHQDNNLNVFATVTVGQHHQSTSAVLLEEADERELWAHGVEWGEEFRFFCSRQDTAKVVISCWPDDDESRTAEVGFASIPVTSLTGGGPSRDATLQLFSLETREVIGQVRTKFSELSRAERSTQKRLRRSTSIPGEGEERKSRPCLSSWGCKLFTLVLLAGALLPLVTRSGDVLLLQ